MFGWREDMKQLYRRFGKPRYIMAQNTIIGTQHFYEWNTPWGVMCTYTWRGVS